MALGDDDVIAGNGLPAGQAAFAPSESTVQIGQQEAGPVGVGTPPARSTPRLRRLLGLPRVSTMVLMSVWVAVLVLYLQVRPGG
ncbi:hypothetical protein BJY24_000895 [Nocardia transvalensis]|uniref:Uncharacterized protein n=1 Tax=Nocardia transvalensis TaxID=37333 RepID=A0A7W9PA86_9NOCA|nr:hypothetical protein [Nocardia transvalensis]MBB5912028.1 hypothetical protein [Nocardia transvalensis]